MHSEILWIIANLAIIYWHRYWPIVRGEWNFLSLTLGIMPVWVMLHLLQAARQTSPHVWQLLCSAYNCRYGWGKRREQVQNNVKHGCDTILGPKFFAISNHHYFKKDLIELSYLYATHKHITELLTCCGQQFIIFFAWREMIKVNRFGEQISPEVDVRLNERENWV